MNPDSTVAIVNHAFCQLAVVIYEWASQNGHNDLCDKLDAWVHQYMEVIDLELALRKDT